MLLNTATSKTMNRIINYTISPSDEDKTIRTFLREHYYPVKIITYFKHTDNSVCLNGDPVFLNTLLKTADILTINYIEEDDSENIVPVPLPFKIVYEDDDILVVDKPADMPVHPAINNFENTLANGIAFYFKEKNEHFVFRCINRLDRNTSGLLIVAKHRLASAILSDFMKNRSIHWEYVALVDGILCKPFDTIDAPIARVNDSIIERRIDFDNGSKAITHYSVIKTYDNVAPFLVSSQGRDFIETSHHTPASLIKLELETGRTHQIRVHMSYIEHPLIGDSLYNKEPGPLSSQALHSHKLSFVHPITLEEMSFTSDSIPFIQDGTIKI